MTVSEYLDKTAPAVEAAFNAIASYNTLIEEDLAVRSASDAAQLEALAAWADNPKVRPLVRPVGPTVPDEALSFARDALYGVIFQVAYRAIKIFSTNAQALPTFCVAGYGGAIPFMIGRKVRGVPLGLVIFAARNHFNHLDLGARLYEINLHVFRELSRNHDLGLHRIDPRFDLLNASCESYTTNVAELIGWETYSFFIDDLSELFRNLS